MMIPYLGIYIEKSATRNEFEKSLNNLFNQIVGNLVCNIVEGKTI